MPGGQGSPRQRPDDRRGQEGSRSLQRAADPGAARAGDDRERCKACAAGPFRGRALRSGSPLGDQRRVHDAGSGRRVPQPSWRRTVGRAHACVPRRRLVDGVVPVLLLVTHLAAFFGVAALVIVTPGQDTALTIRNSLLGGRLSGLSTAVGVCVGQCAWALATSAGLAALLVASEPAFVALRLFGAAYLILLGVQALRSALGRRPSVMAGGGAPAGAPPAVGFPPGLGCY